MATDSHRPLDRWALAALLAASLLVRGGVLWAMRDNLQADPDAYRQIAENVLRHGVFAMGEHPVDGPAPAPTAYRPPLYPLLLSKLSLDRHHVSLVLVAALHLALGVGTVWLTVLTGRSLLPEGTLNRMTTTCDSEGTKAVDRRFLLRYRPAGGIYLAGAIVALDPILLNQQTLVMTETLAAFLAILCLWCLVRFESGGSWFDAALAGGAMGLAILCRPTFLPWLGLVAVAMALFGGGKADARHWRRRMAARVAYAAVLVAAASVVVAPWVVRNQREFGRPIVTTTHGGYTLLLGNNRRFYDWLLTSNRDVPWDAKELDADLDQAWRLYSPESFDGPTNFDRLCNRWAHQVIADRPGAFLVAATYRVGQLWSPLPNKLTANESTPRRLLRYATAAGYCCVYVLAALGAWRLRGKLLKAPWVYGVLLCLAFTAVHTLYWSNLRMRAPLMPFVAIVAAVGIASSVRSKPT